MANQYFDPHTNESTSTQIKLGAAMVDKKGNYIGKVKAVQREIILVDRSIKHCPDLHVPIHKVLNTLADQIQLDIAECDIDRQGW